VTDKPRLGLPRLKPSVKPSAPMKPPLQPQGLPPEQQPYGDALRQIIIEEFARHNERNATFVATMARITADDATFRRFAIPVLQMLCRRQIKKYTRALAREATNQQTAKAVKA
jgi:hypothetical protein